MKIIGIKKVDFTPREGGAPVVGTHLFLTRPFDASVGEGDEAKKVFLSAEKLSSMTYKPKLYDEVTVSYNEYGKVESIEKAR